MKASAEYLARSLSEMPSFSTHEYEGKTQHIMRVGKKEAGEISTTHRDDGHHEVSNVLVWPEFQRKGYGTALYKHAASYARSQGKKLYISNDRTSDAQELHKSFGKTGNLTNSGEVRFG